MRHYNIPIFIPELACPHQCVFCDQHRIAGRTHAPEVDEVSKIIRGHLATIPASGSRVEIAFFGGNFTGIPHEQQIAYLTEARKWVKSSRVSSIRLSTRPDYITVESLKVLKQFGVGTIELGAQSFDDEVLQQSGRGHTAADIERASQMILQSGFFLVLQMMTGLPGDTMEKTMYAARKIVECGASATRIYPCLVIRGTKLEEMFREGLYTPLSLDETIARCKELIRYFERHNVRILRLGLHPTEGLSKGDDLIAGPFHPALKEMVMTAIWEELFSELLSETNREKRQQKLTITISPSQINAALGHRAKNRLMLGKIYRHVAFNTDKNLKGRSFHVHFG